VEVRAIASRTRARAEQLAGRYGIPKVYDDYRSLLEHPSIAVLDLCVPNALHLPLVLEVAKAGFSFPNPDEEWMLGYPQEIQDFVEAVALDRAPLSGLELAKQVVEVVYAGYVSMEERRKVVLSVTT